MYDDAQGCASSGGRTPAVLECVKAMAMSPATAPALAHEGGRLVKGVLGCIGPGQGVNGASGPTGAALAMVGGVLDLGDKDPQELIGRLLKNIEHP
eukprot:3594988-Pyramimonas_sp.AAC.2